MEKLISYIKCLDQTSLQPHIYEREVPHQQVL